MTGATGGRLAGKLAVVSGGSRGIGRAIATRFVQEGARVVIGARSAEPLRAAMAELNRSGEFCRGVGGDLSKAEAVEALAAAAAEWGGIDVLVNNVGGAPAGSFLKLTDEQFLASWSLKFLAGVRLSRAAIPHMTERGAGSIINITGAGGREPGPEAAVIASTNAAIRAVTKSLSREMAPRGIRVNAICPGNVRTERAVELARQTAASRGVTPEVVEAEGLRTTPTGRMVEPSEIAEIALMLAAGDVPSLTGAEIVVDGGRTHFM
ncbi:MAG TPA: SDR family oxidoreductase [Candidatus Dormibacteraeota bacterium]|nr:SDR family oxidoreductase [Candidatus Dormibacteraeota bacterium]